MNHGITIVRHTGKLLPDFAASDELHIISDWGDEKLIAALLCSRLHDDKTTGDAAKRCSIIHVWPLGSLTPFWRVRMFSPDPVCVEKRTAALERWNGTSLPAPSADPCESVIT